MSGGGRSQDDFRHHNSGGGRSSARFPRRQEEPKKGLNKDLPYLDYRPDLGGCKPEAVDSFLDEMRTYVIARFMPGMDDIFDRDNPIYPEIDEPDEPDDDDDRIAMKKWEASYRKYRLDMDRLEEETIKLTGDILSRGSKDLILKTEEGFEAIQDKDSLELIKSIISTHLTSTNTDSRLNFHAAEAPYHQLYMKKYEDINQFYRRFQAAYNSLREAASRVNAEERIPDEESRALHFVSKRTAKYTDYKIAIRRGVIARPETLRRALEKALEFGEDATGGRRSNHHYEQATSIGVFITGGRGRGRGRGGAYGGRGGRGARGGGGGRTGNCHICGESGHWKRECPHKDKKEDEEIKTAVHETAKTKKKN